SASSCTRRASRWPTSTMRPSGTTRGRARAGVAPVSSRPRDLAGSLSRLEEGGQRPSTLASDGRDLDEHIGGLSGALHVLRHRGVVARMAFRHEELWVVEGRALVTNALVGESLQELHQ